MAEAIVNQAFGYAGYALEAGLLVCLLRRRRAKRWLDVFLYVLLLLLIDGVGRWAVFYSYGQSSTQYEYFYWLTDVLLTLAAFLLVCSFFRRAFSRTDKWPYLKLILPLVFLLAVGISCYSLSQHYSNLWGRFIIELQQNLYFACAVLTTALYVMLQGAKDADEELGFLVCGLGLQFAGPAANMAAMLLPHGRDAAGAMLAYVAPLCTLAMLSIWFYAVSRAHQPARTHHPGDERLLSAPALAWDTRIE